MLTMSLDAFLFLAIKCQKKKPNLWNLMKGKWVKLYQRKASFIICEAEKGYD